MINTSGLVPVEYKVLIQADEIVERTSGGLFLTQETIEREKHNQVYATIIAVGGCAFEDWRGNIPKVGDRIMISKLVGQFVDAADRKQYRLINDKDIICIVTKEPPKKINRPRKALSEVKTEERTSVVEDKRRVKI